MHVAIMFAYHKRRVHRTL